MNINISIKKNCLKLLEVENFAKMHHFEKYFENESQYKHKCMHEYGLFDHILSVRGPRGILARNRGSEE